MKKGTLKQLIITTAITATVLLPFMALALPTVETDAPGLDFSDLRKIVEDISTYLLEIAMVVALIVIVWGGLQWIWARGEEKKVTAAKAVIKNGIYGALVILAVGLILNTLAKLVGEGNSIFGG